MSKPPLAAEFEMCKRGFFLAEVTAPDENTLRKLVKTIIPGVNIIEVEPDEIKGGFYAPRITCCDVNESGVCRLWLSPRMPEVCRQHHRPR